ncbi:hypothetical protein D3C75_1008660 [compost metagenome]
MYTLKNQGLLLYGESQNHILPEISEEEIILFLDNFLTSMRAHGKGGSLHSIDWLLLTAKFICWLTEGTILTKSEAADWGTKHLTGQWKDQLPKAKELRKEPEKLKQTRYASWINSLDQVIWEASADLEKLLHERKKIYLENRPVQ